MVITCIVAADEFITSVIVVYISVYFLEAIVQVPWASTVFQFADSISRVYIYCFIRYIRLVSSKIHQNLVHTYWGNKK